MPSIINSDDGVVSGTSGLKTTGGNDGITVFQQKGTESMRIDASGNVGIGITPSSWNAAIKSMQIGAASINGQVQGNGTTAFGDNRYYLSSNYTYIYNGYATDYRQESGVHKWFTAASGTAGNAITFTESMRIDASGNLGIGTASPTSGSVLDVVSGTTTYPRVRSSIGSAAALFFQNNDTGTTTSDGMYVGITGAEEGVIWNNENTDLRIATNNTERARILSTGNLLVGKTASAVGTAGAELYSTGEGSFTRSGATCIYVNRLSDDGDLVRFFQDTTLEGNIAVSGTTVSYNAFAGSHWSQLQDGSKPEILRGTVMESIDELCEWPDEPTSERLCRVKISDTAGSKKVYGVFMDWDNDWTATNDMLVTAVGAFICRVNGSVTVQEGDLLESNGDGTARVQADDIMRSSTIGKVTCTVKTHEFDDGSYCVPTVLYCG